MQSHLTPYFLAVAANLAFGTASIAFSKFAKSHSAMWINQIKVSVALILFTLAYFLTEQGALPSVYSCLTLLASGFLGLCLGDYFLFKAFSTLGTTRTLVLFSFQPFLLGIYGYFFLEQTLSSLQLFAILCMIGCVFTFLLERSRSLGKWDITSFLGAFVGVLFDASGVMLTRTAFEHSPSLGSFQANAIRAIGAVIGFLIIQPKSYVHIFNDIKKLTRQHKTLVFSASIFGTFVSLSLYLQALKTAHVATLTAISITGPVWVSLIEHIRDRELPNRYFVTAFLFVLAGFLFLTFAS